MIKSLFQRIFGAPIAPASNAQPKDEAVAAEPKDELVQVELPVEPGFFYTRDHNRRTNPSRPTLVANSLEHLWSGNALAGELSEQFSQVRSKMLNETIRDSEIQSLIQKDQTKHDYDTRPGHVVIPEKEFEYHGSLETVRYPKTPGRTERAGETFTLETEKGNLRVERDKDTRFYLPNTTPEIPGTSFDRHTAVKSAGEFAVSEEGAVSIPSASTLEEAERVEAQRGLAMKAQTALHWMEAVKKSVDYRIDQFQFDHDPRVGHTVASGIDDYWFFQETGLPSMQHQTYSVEQTPTSLRVYEDSYGKIPELVARVQEQEGKMQMQFAVDRGESSLHLMWDKGKGEIFTEIRGALSGV
ncbi:MAG: hypothetical protein KC800_28835 [Candidatus Eremiobacteraeota bacterium]|nr:hypothetical protein [Candidatus Eremiobacteraeota bacterium]